LALSKPIDIAIRFLETADQSVSGSSKTSSKSSSGGLLTTD